MCSYNHGMAVAIAAAVVDCREAGRDSLTCDAVELRRDSAAAVAVTRTGAAAGGRDSRAGSSRVTRWPVRC